MKCYNEQYYNGVKSSCGYCFACKINRSNEWARRINYEAVDWPDNVFLTLTYDDKFMLQNPTDSASTLREIQLFLKRLRKNSGIKKMKYYAISDYGDLNDRLHYHIIIFGINYKNPAISKSWTKGFIKSKPLHPRNAYYVARYVSKIYGHGYTVCTMSRRNYIGESKCKSQRREVVDHIVKVLSTRNPSIVARNVSWFRSFVRKYRREMFFDMLWKKYVAFVKDFVFEKISKFELKQRAYTKASILFIKHPEVCLFDIVEESRCFIRKTVEMYYKKQRRELCRIF